MNAHPLETDMPPSPPFAAHADERLYDGASGLSESRTRRAAIGAAALA